MTTNRNILSKWIVIIASFVLQSTTLSAQFYTVDFVADQASLITGDCGLLNPVYNTCFGISAGVPNIIDIQPGSMLFIDVEGNGCSPACSGGEAGGDNQNFYETGNIDVSGVAAFSITANFAFWNYADFGVGGNPANCGTVPASLESNPGCGQDMLSFSYSIDGGAWTLFDPAIPNATTVGTGGGLQVSTSGCSLSGTNVRVQIQFGSQSVAEAIVIEGIEFYSAGGGGSSAVASVSQSPICVGDDVVFSETGGVATMWQWANPGGGSAGSNATVNLNDAQLSDAGTWSVTITDGSGCTSVDDVDLMVLAPPTANSNIDIFLCDSGNGTADFDLTVANSSIASGPNPVTWFIDLAGNVLVPDPTNFNASNGTSVFASVSDGTCDSETVEVTLLLTQAPTANAGGPYDICEGEVANLIGSIGGQATSATWSTSGDGSFGNPNSIITTYNPGPADISSGSATITLTTDDVGGTCPAGVDMVVINITQAPIAIPGGPYSICQGQDVQLNGMLGGSANSGLWTSFGDGSFNNASLPNAIYTPGVGDIALGMVTLSLEASTSGSNCNPDTEIVNVTISSAPTIAITSSPTEICGGDAFQLTAQLGGSGTSLFWMSSGDGFFSNPTGAATFYTPGPFDLASGSITIEVVSDNVGGNCTAASDQTIITINSAPTVNIDPVADICEGSSISVFSTLGGSATSLSWISSGDGVFVNPNFPNTVYNPGPGDISSGSVTLQVITDDVNGNCTAAVDDVLVNIIPGPEVSIDPVGAICSGELINLTATVGGNTTTITWSTSGDGTFSNTGNPATTYTPGPSDIASGSVLIIITTDDVNGLCTAASDNIVVAINAGPTLQVDPVGDICSDSDINLNAVIGGSATGINWTTSGDGVFDNPNILSPTYTPGPLDISTGTVTLEPTTVSAGGCPEIMQMISFDIIEAITISIDGATTVCGTAAVGLTATTNQVVAVTWSSSGDGTFAGSGNSVDYNAGPLDISNGTVTIIATTADPAGPCNSETATHIINISTAVSAGMANPTSTYCNTENSILDLFAELNNATTGGTWNEISASPSTGAAFNQGAGTFNPDGQNAGLYEFEYAVIGTPPCTDDSEIVSIQVNAPPSATVATTAVTCNISAQGSIINFDQLITAGDATGSWMDLGPAGVNLTNTSSVDFNGIAPGNYPFSYTTNSATAPCDEVTYTTIITVEDCACPSVATSPIPNQCSDNAMVDLSNYVTTTESGSWTITTAPAGSNPATIVGNDFMGTGTDAGTYTLTYTLDIAPIVNCPDSSVQTITISPTATAGTDEPTLEICNDSNNNIDLFGLLVGEDNIGTWTETSAVSSTGGAFDASNGTFNSQNQLAGSYTFLYSIVGTAPCLDDSEEVTIEVFSSPTATVDLNGQICNSSANGSIFNFDLLVTAGDMGGSWMDTDGTLVNLSNTASVDFNGVPAGNYDFTYTTNSAAGPCTENEYIVNITVEDCACPSVVTSAIPDLCADNALLDLSGYIVTTESGSWSITSIPPGPNPATLAGNNFDGNGADEGLYTLTFTIDAAPLSGCPDSSVQTINLVSPANSGTATFTVFSCNSELVPVDLTQFITTADAGGSWSETSTIPSTGGAFDAINASFLTTNVPEGTYNFTYTIASNGPCVQTSTEYTVFVEAALDATLANSFDVCNETSNGSIVNFNNLILSGATSGSWTDNGSGVDLTDLSQVDFNGVTPGSYTFDYDLPAGQNCPALSFSTTINVENCACPSVLTGMLPDLCSSNGVLDLSGFIVTTEPGTWSLTNVPAGISPGVLAGNFFNGASGDPGEYTFTFTLDAAPIANCPDSSVQTLMLFTPPNSGMSGSILTACNTDATALNLSQFVAGADVGGVWTETSPVISTGGAFDPTAGTFNPIGQAGAIYNFTYSLPANGPCIAASTEYSVIIEEGLSATLTPLVDICNSTADGSTLNFTSLITAGSTAGNWQQTSGQSVDLTDLNNVDFDGFLAGTYSFTYSFPAGQFCSAQSYTTEITVQDCACPNIQTLPIPDFCENDMSVDLSDYNFPGQIGAWSLTNNPTGITPPTLSGTMLDIVSGDPGLYELTYTLAGGPFAGCPDSSVLNFSILANSTFNYNSVICSGDSIVVNNMVYNAGTLTGTEVIAGGAANGCDSIVIINLTLANEIQLPAIDTMLCEGEELLVNGVVFNQSNLTGTVFYDQAGCDSTRLVTIDFFPPSIGTYTTTLCAGETLDINGTIFSETNPTGPVFYPLGSVNGCDSTVNVTVTFDSNISSGLTSINDICLGDSLALNFDFSTGGIFDVAYSINSNTFNLSGISNGHVEMIYVDSDATIVLEDAMAIGATCSVDIPLAPLMINVTDVEANVVILTNFNGYEVSCAGSSDAEVMIDVLGGTSTYTFDWNGATPDLDNLEEGMYQATITDLNGCRDSLNFEITGPDPTTIEIIEGDVNCSGDLSGSILINDIIGNGSTYSYSFNNIDFAPIAALPFEIQGLAAGTMDLYIEDENECGVVTTANINSPNNLLIDVSPDRTIQLGDSVVLDVSANFTIGQISWSPSQTLSCNDCPNPIAKPFETTLYRVRLIDTSGCEVEANIELRVEKSNVYIPNAFSPNNDGNNDLFFLQSANENLIIEQMIIVDRWGEVVFQTEDVAVNNPSNGWNGRLQNKPLNPGVFVYYIQVKYPNGNIVPMKGDITLLR